MNVLDHGFVELISKTGHASMVVDAARCSYGSGSDDLGDKDQKLIRFLLGNGHTSPFRHFMFTFHIKAPLFVFRQMWKYQVGSVWREYELADGDPLRILRSVPRGQVVASDIQIDTDQGCSWNELSGRYKVMEREFYMPEVARRNTGKQEANSLGDDELTERMRARMALCISTAEASYHAMLRAGVAKELARLVLPPTIYSECYWTVSLQAVLHFLDQRLAPEAQFEIRAYAKGILDLIRPDLEAMGIER